MSELDKLYRDFGYWKVQEELVKSNLMILGKKISDELTKQQSQQKEIGAI